MKKLHMIAATGATSVVIAASVASPVYAWHPKGQIVKSVQNVTSGSALSDANTASSAVVAKPGDTLKYVIVVSNIGTASSNGMNDMAQTVLNDTLPSGVALVSDASKRQITENLGTIKPGLSVTKEYTVKVVATTEGVIENKACFTGDSTAHDNPQAGCDTADVKVTVPSTPVTPPAPVTPVPEQPKPVAPAPVVATPTAVALPAELPKTGQANIMLLGALIAAVGYALSVLRLKSRACQ